MKLLTQTGLRKHDVIKVCSIDYLTTQIELVLPKLGLLSSLRNIYHSTTASFFDPQCMCLR